jgi:hypothetical protein
MGRPDPHRELKCKKCEKFTPHTLKDNDYFCDVCGSVKFIGFPEYVCHSENQRMCIVDNHGMNTTWCLGCPKFY